VDGLLLLSHLFYERRVDLPNAVRIIQKSERVLFMSAHPNNWMAGQIILGGANYAPIIAKYYLSNRAILHGSTIGHMKGDAKRGMIMFGYGVRGGWCYPGRIFDPFANTKGFHVH
jgi:hypothetical protein